MSDDGALRMEVLPEITQLRGTEMSLPAQSVSEKARLDALSTLELRSATAEIELLFQPKPVSLKISDGTQEILAVAFDPTRSGRERAIGGRLTT
jgi:hypothetical protein